MQIPSFADCSDAQRECRSRTIRSLLCRLESRPRASSTNRPDCTDSLEPEKTLVISATRIETGASPCDVPRRTLASDHSIHAARVPTRTRPCRKSTKREKLCRTHGCMEITASKDRRARVLLLHLELGMHGHLDRERVVSNRTARAVDTAAKTWSHLMHRTYGNGNGSMLAFNGKPAHLWGLRLAKGTGNKPEEDGTALTLQT